MRQGRQQVRHRRSPAPTSDRRRSTARARRRSSCRRSRRAGSTRPRRQRQAIGATRVWSPPGSLARCGARSSPHDDTPRSHAPRATAREAPDEPVERSALASAHRHHPSRSAPDRPRCRGTGARKTALAAAVVALPTQLSACGGSSRMRITGDGRSHSTPSRAPAVASQSVERRPIAVPSAPPTSEPSTRTP